MRQGGSSAQEVTAGLGLSQPGQAQAVTQQPHLRPLRSGQVWEHPGKHNQISIQYFKKFNISKSFQNESVRLKFFSWKTDFILEFLNAKLSKVI